MNISIEVKGLDSLMPLAAAISQLAEGLKWRQAGIAQRMETPGTEPEGASNPAPGSVSKLAQTLSDTTAEQAPAAVKAEPESAPEPVPASDSAESAAAAEAEQTEKVSSPAVVLTHAERQALMQKLVDCGNAVRARGKLGEYAALLREIEKKYGGRPSSLPSEKFVPATEELLGKAAALLEAE